MALASMIAEDIAIATGTGFDMAQEYRDLAEAVGMFVYATGNLEKAAATGALVFTAARCP